MYSVSVWQSVPNIQHGTVSCHPEEEEVDSLKCRLYCRYVHLASVLVSQMNRVTASSASYPVYSLPGARGLRAVLQVPK